MLSVLADSSEAATHIISQIEARAVLAKVLSKNGDGVLSREDGSIVLQLNKQGKTMNEEDKKFHYALLGIVFTLLAILIAFLIMKYGTIL